MIDSITAGDTPVPAINTAAKDDPAKVRDAAKQFEALLIGQMMKSMRDAEGGWLGTGDDESACIRDGICPGEFRAGAGRQRRVRDFRDG